MLNMPKWHPFTLNGVNVSTFVELDRRRMKEAREVGEGCMSRVEENNGGKNMSGNTNGVSIISKPHTFQYSINRNLSLSWHLLHTVKHEAADQRK